MKLLLARVLFFLARKLQSKGMMLGQWFQNKGILLLSKIGPKRD